MECTLNIHLNTELLEWTLNSCASYVIRKNTSPALCNFLDSVDVYNMLVVNLNTQNTLLTTFIMLWIRNKTAESLLSTALCFISEVPHF